MSDEDIHVNYLLKSIFRQHFNIFGREAGGEPVMAMTEDVFVKTVQDILDGAIDTIIKQPQRPIKFRGLAKESKQWVYGYYRYHKETNTHYIIRDYDDVPVFRETVGQCLNPGAPTEYYEGDFVYGHDVETETDFSGFIVYKNFSFAIFDPSTQIYHYRWIDYEITKGNTIFDESIPSNKGEENG